MKKTLLLLPMISLGLCASCSTSHRTQGRTPCVYADETSTGQAIAAILIRKAVADLERGDGAGLNFSVYCLERGVAPCDPSPDLMAALPKFRFPAVPRSECEPYNPPRLPGISFRTYRHSPSGQNAVLVDVGPIEWISPTEVTVSYGWHYASLASRSQNLNRTPLSDAGNVACVCQRTR